MNSFDSLVSYLITQPTCYTHILYYPISDGEIHIVATDNNNNISFYVFVLIDQYIYKLVSWTLYIYEEAEWRGSHGFIDPAAAAASPFFFSSTEAIILVYTAWLYCVCAGNYFTQINAYIVNDDEEKK